MGNTSIGPIDQSNLSISPNFRVNDWINARDSNNWENMVEIFNDRLEGRFLKPIRLILSDSEIGGFSGFSIIAIDCLIIETLNQFYNGIDQTKGKHKKAFWKFFKNSQFFKEQFDKERAYTFYKHFRCGILHQAQTKERSVLRIGENEMVSNVNDNISEGLVVDRGKFHEALEAEINTYKNKLRNGDVALQKNFIAKMNLICGIE